jgi:hypothetical protein
MASLNIQYQVNRSKYLKQVKVIKITIKSVLEKDYKIISSIKLQYKHYKVNNIYIPYDGIKFSVRLLCLPE